MPAKMPEQFDIPCVLEREDARDVFVSLKYKSISDLPHGALIGTSSARRAAQLLAVRPDIKTIPLRGNINTRLRKLEEGALDATFLAFAGLIRVGLFNDATMHPIPAADMLPAVSQGAIGIEILNNNTVMRDILRPINHVQTQQRTNMERSFMRVFEGSCTTPIAAYAQVLDEKIYFQCLIAKPDGTVIHRTECAGSLDNAEKMGSDCANLLKDLAGDNFFV
jgi:hydroxymethylbilane synthase